MAMKMKVFHYPEKGKIATFTSGLAAEFEVDGPEQFGIAVSLDHAELLDKLNAGLENVKANGTYDELIDKYFGAAE